jgi:uncharacterized protein YehS (DUF1456 family)
MEERIFALERNIKRLDVSEPLANHEYVYAKFDKGFIYVNDEKNNLKPIKNGVLLISNHRLIIQNKVSYSIYYDNIKNIEYKKYGFSFFFEEMEMILRSHDQETLNNTLDIIFKRKVKNVIKKYKNN